MTIEIYHNPRCSKSRQTLALLEERGFAPDIVFYLDEAPSASAIKAIAEKLKLSDVREMMRTNETHYKDLDLKSVSNQETLINAMAKYPILIERPIVVNGENAAIGRPPEAVLEIL